MAEDPRKAWSGVSYLSKAEMEAREREEQAELERAQREAAALRRKLARDKADVAVASKVEDGVTIVTATINGKASGRFIVDTGASMVTLSEAFASRLGLDLTRMRQGSSKVADGRNVTIHLTSLASVEVGECRVKDVPAAILPQPPASGIDGLLGMSFLKHATLSVDDKTGSLIVRPAPAR